ncbi:DUF2637 domain-containing protein [Actinomadura opuntiae]|uniref:DUF2637 domain-containing protein n=1 Tax=Actinomadura sp. OS1-43 TaxID=604315 RepID=UPI00255AF82A|nr:DUF2637 domain-containing protein [Actinomadura sp. OS1-43]MDL4815301.1 DUF2637 domain-containing protein [Actinomadura sp. OS1-43]
MRRILAVAADSAPVVILAGIAAAGSFTHIRDTATDHGQRGWMAWAIAVCIDLTCVMAAGERQRDKRTGRDTGRLSWPTLVLVGGILLSLAANLAQADRSVWGWITAGTPALAFLVAVSMLERRKTAPAPANEQAPAPVPVPDSSGLPSSTSSPSSPWVVWEDDRPQTIDTVPTTRSVRDDRTGGGDVEKDARDGQTAIPVPAVEESAASSPGPAPAAPLVEFARRVAFEHRDRHGKPITRDELRARLGVSNQLASDLLRQIRTESVPVA